MLRSQGRELQAWGTAQAKALMAGMNGTCSKKGKEDNVTNV